MTRDSENESSGTDGHTVDGTGMDTVAKCPDTGQQYGPGAVNETAASYCPYCGETVENGDHRVARRYSEVFCENTNMANWRYCPGCGAAEVETEPRGDW